MDITISDFPRYGTQLSEAQRTDLRRLARALVGAALSGTHVTVSIAGHADFDAQGRAFEDQVSLQRAHGAETALTALVKEEAAIVQLLDSSLQLVQYQVTGFGTRVPVFPNPASEGERRGNRRVVFTWSSSSPTPPPPSHDTPPATQFEIRLVGGFSAAALVQADNYFFQIVDLVRHKTAYYFYTGGGLSISIPKIPGPGSMSWTGPPTKFSTTRPTELYQFNSRASLYQDPGATVGPASVGGTFRLSVDEIQDRSGLIFTVPSIIPIEGGSGIQMPGLGSATEGVLVLNSDIFEFTGY